MSENNDEDDEKGITERASSATAAIPNAWNKSAVIAACTSLLPYFMFVVITILQIDMEIPFRLLSVICPIVGLAAGIIGIENAGLYRKSYVSLCVFGIIFSIVWLLIFYNNINPAYTIK